MQYLTWWRMQIAWQEITIGKTSTLVAEMVGYHSEAAFSRAFKREFGITARSAKQHLEKKLIEYISFIDALNSTHFICHTKR